MGKIQSESSSGSSSRDSSVSIRSSVGNPPRMPRKDDQLPSRLSERVIALVESTANSGLYSKAKVVDVDPGSRVNGSF